MARAIWSGSISFGLLNVPVKLYSAVSKKSVSFRELRESDSSRIRHKRVAEADGEEVAYDDIVKGADVGNGQYVMLTPEGSARCTRTATSHRRRTPRRCCAHSCSAVAAPERGQSRGTAASSSRWGGSAPRREHVIAAAAAAQEPMSCSRSRLIR